jgi:hypothetical protein
MIRYFLLAIPFGFGVASASAYQSGASFAAPPSSSSNLTQHVQKGAKSGTGIPKGSWHGSHSYPTAGESDPNPNSTGNGESNPNISSPGHRRPAPPVNPIPCQPGQEPVGHADGSQTCEPHGS